MKDRRLWVYTPNNYSGEKQSYGLLILFDGESYVHLVPTATILDNLIAAKKIEPTIAVFVDNPAEKRDEELSCSRSFADYVSNELLPFIRKQFRIDTGGSHVTISGSSLGGLQSVCTVLYHPDSFRNVLAQSGSFWWKPDSDTNYEWVSGKIRKLPVRPIRFYLSIGLLENMPKPGNTNQLKVNRNLFQVLKQKGYMVTYHEFYGAHEYVDWQGTLADGLIALIGTRRY